MSLVYDPGDHPADVLNRASAITFFLTEALGENRPFGQDLTLSDEALTGFALITKTLAREMDYAARDA